MNFRRLGVVVAAVAVASATSIIGATSASATTYTGTFNCLTHPGGTISVAAGDTINFSSLTNCGNIAVISSKFSAASATDGGGAVSPYTPPGINTYWQALGMTAFSITVAGGVTGSFTITGSDNQSNQPTTVYTITVSGGGGGGGGSSSSSSSTPQTLTLEVAASGASCTGGNPSGVSGAWLTLPGAEACTQSGPTAKPGATLLGWATSASFPIARAQSQIDKHWGVIDEVIDGVRMIFIPGGMAAFVSGSNNLYPIWSK